MAQGTVMRIVRRRGRAVLDGWRGRDGVLRAPVTHPTRYATGVTDLSLEGPARLLVSEDMVEGITAFVEKHTPQWLQPLS